MIIPIPDPIARSPSLDVPGPSRRALYGVPVSSGSNDNVNGASTDPKSATVLVPLVISMGLVFAGLGLAVFFYVRYRRKYRVWLEAFQARRERERAEGLKEEDKGPGMWEVEVKDVNEDEDHGWAEEYTYRRNDRGEQDLWSQPVSVIYHHNVREPNAPLDLTASSNIENVAQASCISSISQTASSAGTTTLPEHVEMTFLIAMPSPSPSRSRRSSPASSMPSLEKDKDQSSSISISDLGSLGDWGDEIPEVELATVIIPLGAKSGQA